MVVGTIRASVAAVVTTASFTDSVSASEKPTWLKTWPNVPNPENRSAA